MRSFVACSASVLLLVAGLAAQDPPIPRFGGTNPSPVQQGGQLEVHYENPALANTCVTVTATDLGDPSQTRSVPIPLGANGKGHSQMTVPLGWEGVVLTHPTSTDLLIATFPPPPEGMAREPGSEEPRPELVAARAGD